MRTEGEPIDNDDLEKFLKLLVGDEGSKSLKPVITSDDFAENILGFEEVEEEDEEEAVQEGEEGQIQEET